MNAWRTLFIIFLLPLGILRAESEIRMKALENRVSNLENNGASDKPTHPITPCAGPRVKNGMDLHLFADFIYWTARLDTLTYAKTGHGSLSSNISPTKGKDQSVDWSWDPGFKAGLGWSFCHGCWDMNLQYTWLYTNVGDTKHSNFMVPAFQILPPSLHNNDLNFNRAHAHFDLHYQVGDLELGRNYYVSKTLKLRPFIGAKGTWQKQDYNVFYDAIPISTLNNTFNFNAKFNHSIWGIGMRAGVGSSWQFSKHVGLYGSLALTGIWLHYDTLRKDTFKTLPINPQTPSVETTTLSIQDRLRLVKPVLEFALGLRIESYFGCGRYHFLLQGGWESQIWVNQTLYISRDNSYDKFDLNLHGLTTKIRFDF